MLIVDFVGVVRGFRGPIESLVFIGGHISPSKTHELVLTDPAFVVLRFASRDWRLTFAPPVELGNGLRELTTFAER